MRYQVPQFIEVEDKIFGPLTARQFIYLGGGAGVTLAFISILPLFIAIGLSIPFVALSLALAFYKVNGRPFLSVLENAFSYFISSKLYLWSAERPKTQTPAQTKTIEQQEALVPKLSESKLRDLAWSLNIKDRKLVGQDEEKDLVV